jgi:hypothetical protein
MPTIAFFVPIFEEYPPVLFIFSKTFTGLVLVLLSFFNVDAVELLTKVSLSVEF